MRLHRNPDEFLELIELTSKKIHIPAIAVRKDYFITIILNNLEGSGFTDRVVFKGGTSLSKCYPNSIERFLEDEEQLKTIIRITKETDSHYLEKRHISEDYNPLDEYAFERWKDRFSKEVVTNYESLHKTLLFTDRKQDWNEVLVTFERINKIFEKIAE